MNSVGLGEHGSEREGEAGRQQIDSSLLFGRTQKTESLINNFHSLSRPKENPCHSETLKLRSRFPIVRLSPVDVFTQIKKHFYNPQTGRKKKNEKFCELALVRRMLCWRKCFQVSGGGNIKFEIKFRNCIVEVSPCRRHQQLSIF